MRFAPKTEEALVEEREERLKSALWEKGRYDFTVMEKAHLFGKEFLTCDTSSKKGNDMIQLAIQVFNDEGEFIVVPDYLLESMGFKLRHIAYATGLGEQYEKGDLGALDFVGKSGVCELDIQKSKDPQYPDKNVVKDYVPVDGDAPKPLASKSSAPALDDEIPFM